MGRSRRFAARIGIFAVTAALAMPIGPAWAGCSVGDLLNGLEGTVGAVTSGACAAACADGVGCPIAGTLATALLGVAADASQGDVNNFCSAVQNVLNNLNNGQSDADTIAGLLSQAGISGTAAQSVAGTIGNIASPFGIAACACSIEQGVGQLGGDVGACIQDALCSLDDLIGSPCSCTPPPPVQADCAIPNTPNTPNAPNTPDTACGYFDPDPACQGQGTIIQGPAGYTPVNTVPGANGTLVTSGGNSSDGHGHCSPVQFCFCPKPMIPKWLTDYARDPSGQFSIFTCECPGGTHLAGSAGGIPVCLCDKTNQPPNPPDSFTGMCPPHSCPSGQVKIGEKCVPSCSKPNQVLLASGQCCNPAQATSCGICCPAGQSPDPKTGSCVSSFTPVHLQPSGRP